MQSFVTDLNKRERLKFTELLQQMAKYAQSAADAISAENDTKALVPVITLAMLKHPFIELVDVFKNGVEADAPHDVSSITNKVPKE